MTLLSHYLKIIFTNLKISSRQQFYRQSPTISCKIN
jgi:hypothetical protein